MIFGTSFCHPYIRDHFQLSIQEAFAELLKLKLGLVRLSCYWSEIEREKANYDFSELIGNGRKSQTNSGDHYWHESHSLARVLCARVDKL